jgi:hypothetical protein
MGINFTSTNSKIAKEIIKRVYILPLELLLTYLPNIKPINPPIIPSVKPIGIRNSMSGNIGEINSNNALNIPVGIKCKRSDAKYSACFLNKNINNKFSSKDKTRYIKNPL